MLKRDSILVVSHREACKRSIQFLRNQPWSTLMTVVMIAITLMLASLTWMASYQMNALRGYWQNSEHISLYLHHDLAEAKQQQFLEKIRSMPEVGTAKFTSAADGLVLLAQQEGMQDMMRYLPQNPLPAMIEVTPSATVTNPEAVKNLYHHLQQSPEVEDAQFDMDWLGRLYAAMGFLKQVTQGLMILLAGAVMLVIGNTLRLIIHHRSEEIKVLQFLGAPNAFIMRPFLYSGIWYGLLAAGVAIVLTEIFMIMLRTGLNHWAHVYQMQFSLTLMPISVIFYLIGTAIVLGWISARITVKHYL